MKYSDIPQYLTNRSNYHIDVHLRYLSKTIREYIEEDGLILNPDFQRGHVWTELQQQKYVEYLLRGGKSGRDIYLNNPSHQYRPKTDYNDFVCVDGLQRITALLKFWDNKLKVFGYYQSEFEDTLKSEVGLSIHINDLQTKQEVLQWYIEMNEGGTPHSQQEIDRVKELLKQEMKQENEG